MNRPSKAEPLLMQCTVCHGKPLGCTACKQTGFTVLTDCPLEHITADTHFAVTLADLVEKAGWPKAGGALDQTSQFLEAAQQVWYENAHWKAAANSK